ncbi:MAG: hypothetical protein GX195_08250 [Firmicutes bacterium]|nr:hypothetical protein [Bacillota bacterium]
MARTWIAVLTAALVLSLAAPGLAQFDVKAQLTYGGTSYSSLLDKETKGSVSEWSVLALGTYSHQDLLFNVLYQNANRLNMTVNEVEEKSTHGRSFANLGASYRFLQETGMEVYGGLGYSLMWLNLKHSAVRDNAQVGLAGRGFSGQAAVRFTLAENFSADAYFTAAPWLKWEYTQGNKSIKQIDGSAYHYQLGLEYDVTAQYSVRLGVQGGSYSVGEFKYDVDELGPTSAGYSGVTVGVTVHF